MTEIPLTVTDAAEALRAGSVTSVELTTEMLARADALDAKTGTYLTRFDEYALATAEAGGPGPRPTGSTRARTRGSRSASRTSWRWPRDRPRPTA